MESAFDTIAQITNGYVLPRCLHVVAELGVADALEDTSQSAARLAQKTGTDPDALDRVLRLLAAHGVFEVSHGHYGHSPASRLLRTDHPQSLRAYVRMLGLPLCWKSFGELQHSVQTGLPAANLVAHGGWWGYLRESPEASRIFDEAMQAKAQGQIPRILNAYDFSRFASLADIGGGRGHLLQAILEASPHTTGVLFDQPPVVQEAAAVVSERVRRQAGDFFRDALPTCDGYILMEVIHDWSDQESIQILQAVRRAAPPHAKVLLIETIIPDDNKPHWGKVLDLFMLTLLTGRQRTAGEYARLLAAAGLQLEREIAAAADLSLLEATPV